MFTPYEGAGRAGALHLYVHRVAAAIWLGFDIDSRMLVCHSCDNPPCFNPRHLFFGTNADNSRDMTTKGRHLATIRRGPHSPNAKLSEDQLAEILRRLAAGELQKNLAAEFGISRAQVSRIATGKRWGHADRPKGIPSGAAHGERAGSARLTAEQVTEARQRYASGGVTIGQLARDYAVGRSTMHSVLHNKTWTSPR